ncbi:MAG: hypothetical protein M3N06_01120 [Pseudomonadota bacterium]|jgi:hypothetical protein|nr:hypothetical protein [Pseudomonadota bacterium]
MSILPPPVGPIAAMKDFAAVFRHGRREKMIGAALAILSTIIIVILFLVDPQINTAPPPTIIYVEQYGPKRTDADIKRDQIKDQRAKEAAKEARKKEFQLLEKKLGM